MFPQIRGSSGSISNQRITNLAPKLTQSGMSGSYHTSRISAHERNLTSHISSYGAVLNSQQNTTVPSTPKRRTEPKNGGPLSKPRAKCSQLRDGADRIGSDQHKSPTNLSTRHHSPDQNHRNTQRSKLRIPNLLTLPNYPINLKITK